MFRNDGRDAAAACPPVRLLLSQVREHVRRLQPPSPARTAELPQIGSGSLIAINEVIPAKLVDLAADELREAVRPRSSRAPKLLLVIHPRDTALSSEPALLLLGSATL